MTDVYRAGRMDIRRTYTLRQAAADGNLVFCKCNLCRRKVVFLATDLVQILSPMSDALAPPFACSKCKKADYVKVSCRVPYPEDYGKLKIRRLREIRPVAFWKTALLE